MHSFMVILLTERNNNFTLGTKEGSIPSEAVKALANKIGLNGKLTRLNTLSQSPRYYFV